MKCNSYLSVSFLLVACLSTCHGFFWNTQPAAEPPQQKTLPMGLFRTYSYHPLTLQTPSLPASFRIMPSNNNLYTPQILAKSSTVGTFTPQTILAPVNIVATGPSNTPSAAPQQPALPQQQPLTAAAPPAQQTQQTHHTVQQQQIPDMAGYHSMVQHSHQIPPQHIQINHQPQIQQGHTQLNHQQKQHQEQQINQQRQFAGQFYPENPFQYIPPPPQYNLQQVQFVPCMCPVTLGLNPEPYSASPVEKRTDDPVGASQTVETQPQQMIEASVETKA